MESGSTEIIFECSEFRAFKDGHVERASDALVTVPAGFDPDTGVTSRDVVVDAATGVAARLYLPTIQAAPSCESGGGNSATTTRLPVLVFFHGGYFIVGSPRHPKYHRYVNSLAARARVVAVSVDYRLAPEHLLPAAYDDACAALDWVASGSDPWLSEHGDLVQVFLSGVSAGANIAHNMAVSAAVAALQSTTPTPVSVEGVVLLHPSFAGEQKMEAEEEEFWQNSTG
jgi:acetyl esterase/lipase